MEGRGEVETRRDGDEALRVPAASPPSVGSPTPGPAPGRWKAIREFLYGLTGYEFARQALELRHELEGLFILVTYGDMVGLPVMPPYYSLRLLPYVVPQVSTWKRKVLRERHPLDNEELDLIEM
jgi:hypothetical protein